MRERAQPAPAPLRAAAVGGAPSQALRGDAGMTMQPPPEPKLPHHTLFAYQLCLELVRLVARIRISDAQLRQQARKSATSAARACSRGGGGPNRADARCFDAGRICLSARSAGDAMPGVIAVAQPTPARIAIEDLVVVLACSTAEDWRDQVSYLPLR